MNTDNHLVKPNQGIFGFTINKTEIILLITSSILATIIVKIPAILNLIEDDFYAKNLSFIILPFLMIYFSLKNKITLKKAFIPFSVMVVSIVFINSLPVIESNASLILACMHLPIIIWLLLGYFFTNGAFNNVERGLDYLKFNANLVIMSTLLTIAGMLFTMVTVGLFKLIDINVDSLYFNVLGIWGLVSIPIIATYLVDKNPGLVNKISPIIAVLFTPVVIITLFLFLISLISTKKDIYHDRNFLIVFNVLLVGVICIIIFSLTEAVSNQFQKVLLIFLIILSILTIIVDGIALSAIAFRLSTFGISANRIAVLMINILVLTNLILLSFQLFKVVKKREKLESVISKFLFFIPVYAIWACVVVFLFPIIFQYK